IEAARATGCEAIHPGYGFLSEAPDFAGAVRGAGLVFIGPPEAAIRAMGVKTQARAIMQAAGVPVVPGYQSANAGDDDFLQAAAEIGYPVMVKAAGGGGGKGIRTVREPGELPAALASARREAGHAFVDSTVYLERFVATQRHTGCHVLAYDHARVSDLIARDCCADTRLQKFLADSSSPFVWRALHGRMGAAAVEAARAVGYVSAGTVEFIAGP